MRLRKCTQCHEILGRNEICCESFNDRGKFGHFIHFGLIVMLDGYDYDLSQAIGDDYDDYDDYDEWLAEEEAREEYKRWREDLDALYWNDWDDWNEEDVEEEDYYNELDRHFDEDYDDYLNWDEYGFVNNPEPDWDERKRFLTSLKEDDDWDAKYDEVLNSKKDE